MTKRKTAPAANSVLLLTREVLLALDITQALAAVGVPVVTRATPRVVYAAVVVDHDALTKRRAALVSRLCHEGVPMIVICDSEAKARFIGGANVIWFQKPFSSEDLAEKIGAAIGDTRNKASADPARSDEAGAPPPP